MNSVHAFFEWNRRISRALTPARVYKSSVLAAYPKIAGLLLSDPSVKYVLDVGAGNSCHVPPHCKEQYHVYVIGMDIDPNRMSDNDLLDARIVGDAVQDIPVRSSSIDLITAYSVVEHFSDTKKFLDNAFRALRPGGYLLAQFPGRYAPFAVINRMLPRTISKRLLEHLTENANELGFPAMYDKTNYSSFKRTAVSSGFNKQYYYCSYYSGYYFEFFVPLYVATYSLDAVRNTCGIKNLASYNLWVLQKTES